MADDLFASMAVSASGLSAQRKRMDAIAKNIANAETTRTEEGGPYLRRKVVLSSTEEPAAGLAPAAPHRVSLERTSSRHLGGRSGLESVEGSVSRVEAEEVVDPDAGYRIVYDPEHPDADEAGYVRLPDVNSVTEMVDMMAATRAYEANLAAMRAYQSMVSKSLDI
jgi:flagellar basal-body rod protein FlgC